MKSTLIPTVLAPILAGLLPAPSRAESVIVQWEKNYNGPGDGWEEPSAVAIDSAGNVFVTGISGSAGPNADYYTAKYAAADGALLWEKRYSAGSSWLSDIPFALAIDNAGNAIVTGESEGDIYTARYAAADGALLWERRYNAPVDGRESAHAVAVDSANNVIVTGETCNNAIERCDFYTAKYAATDGALLWEKRYNGPANASDVPWGLALDSAGNAIVTGYSYATEVDNNADAYTAKYAASNGALLWERRYNGPGNGFDGAEDVAVDNEGNAIVTGLSNGGGDNIDFYTAKYAAANGVLIWEKRHNGSGNGDDRAGDVAVDSAGNAIVTGSSTGTGGNGDFYTAKYAAADGTLLWEKRYNGTGNGNDQPRNVALDSAGNPVVFGVSAGGGGMYDFYTAKYAAENGALIWERRNGPAFPQSYSSWKQLALTPDGGVVVTGGSGSQQSEQDFFTVKYVPVDLDGDDDGLLDSWEMAHFGGREGQSALDDTDGDGAVELLELAFGTDPKSPGSVPAPAVLIEGGYLTTSITKQPCLRYFVQTSATLDAGFSAASTTVLTDTASTLKVRDNVLIGTQPARFLRVQVTAAP